MKVEGSCHCGAIKYEATIDSSAAFVCHCSDCQILSGSVFRVIVPAAAANFVIKSGSPKIYVKIAESGNRRAQGFCGNCGTSIYSADAENATTFMLRVGSIHQRADIVPFAQSWCGSAIPWTQNLGALVPHQRGIKRS
jgi:hypothetical protein